MNYQTQVPIYSGPKYDPFGMVLVGRSWSPGSEYRYGFNGKEDDPETYGDGNIYDYGFRIYNPRLCKFLSVDPLAKSYPWYSPFQFAGNNPIKFIDLDGLEPSENPENPENQAGRNPTEMIQSIYAQSGGDLAFEANFLIFLKGTSDPNASTNMLTNKDGFTSDSKNAEQYNLWVNNEGAFYAQDYTNYENKDLCNFLLGCLIEGVGPENIIFPTNGTVSNELKDAGIVSDALDSWYELNKGRSELTGGIAEFSGTKHQPATIFGNGVFDPETFMASASVFIYPMNENEIKVEIYNIMSITSGDYNKHLPSNIYPLSVVRDNSLQQGAEQNKFGNISQTFSFTIPIDSQRLKD